ncbi:MAG: prepilin-type N-terminal cleavage/methylation domain-containing protein, partial [Oleiphilaceae bacterium]
MKVPYKSQSGFTLIELVMVIVLIGVLSYGAASLYSSRDGFAGFIAKDQLISSGLLAQQVAMGMSATVNPVSLKVERSSDDVWVFTLTKVGVGLSPVISSQDASGNSISVDGTVLTAGASQTFTWNSNASMNDGANHHVYFVG